MKRKHYTTYVISFDDFVDGCTGKHFRTLKKMESFIRGFVQSKKYGATKIVAITEWRRSKYRGWKALVADWFEDWDCEYEFYIYENRLYAGHYR